MKPNRLLTMVSAVLFATVPTLGQQHTGTKRLNVGGLNKEANPPPSVLGTSNPPAYEDVLVASNRRENDQFGFSAAISGDTAVVSTVDEDGAFVDSGAAYVFVRNANGEWIEQAYLKASNPDAADWFGYGVAISGDTIVVGARQESSNATGVNGNQSDNSASNSGAAYVFVRDANGTWTQQAYLKASNTGAGDNFGHQVAISGDTIVVSAWQEDSNATGVNGNGSDNSASNSGAAYVFVRDANGTWTQQAYLKASNTGANDQFGFRLDISGDTIVVGGRQEDSNATGVNGDQNNESSANSGAAYVYVRDDGGNWTQQAYLKASNTGADDWFGHSVALSGDTLAVGARFEDSSATGINGDQSNNNAVDSGAAYIFVRDAGGNWTQQAYFKASNAETGDDFGWSVGVDGDIVLVGAPYEDSAATGIDGDQNSNNTIHSGAAYLFVRDPGGNWSQRSYIKAPNSQSPLEFARNVGSSGNFALITAHLDHAGLPFAGSAHVLTGIIPCHPDNCSGHGVCNAGTCECDAGFAGPGCDQCASDHYSYPDCIFCEASATCSGHGTCNETATCDCSAGFSGAACDQCAPDYFDYPNCIFCSPSATCSDHGTCNESGTCDCDTGYAGAACDQCAPGYSNYPDCVGCDDLTTCSGHGTCDASGECDCDTRFVGTACDQCAPDHYDYPNCVFCTASATCSGNGTCNAQGSCDCDTGFAGSACDQCAPDHYDYPNCVFCTASATCSDHGTCNASGTCDCDTGFARTACDQCAADYFDYPNCVFCSTSATCSDHGTCNESGTCECDTGYAGTACDQCAPGYSNYPNCVGCDDLTTCSGHGTCNASGECDCDTGFAGTACDQCAPDYYDYPNCVLCIESATCSGHGTCNALGTCDCDTGFSGTACDQCAPDHYDYPNCVFCTASATCSGHGTCNPLGTCDCDSGFIGTACDQCAPDYYDYANCIFCNASVTCSGHGTCNALGTCDCDTGYAGAACDQCAAGYYGSGCAPCPGGEENPCSGNGLCDDGIDGDGTCTCEKGYSGPACSCSSGEDCDDGNPCNGEETCDPETGDCLPGEDLICDDNNECTQNLCDPASGCDFSQPVVCDDGNACTLDLCDPETGCDFSQQVACDDLIPCTQNMCDPPTGCFYLPDDSACSDSFDCTINQCDLLLGCVTLPDHGFCSDGLFCNGVEVCDPLATTADAEGCRPALRLPCLPNQCNEAADTCRRITPAIEHRPSFAGPEVRDPNK